MRYFDNSIVSNPGSDIVIDYAPVVRDDGSIDLEVSGKHNIQDEIDSYKESCDLETIIKRYENGDLEALNRYNPQYGDFTEFPKTYAEILQIQIDSNNLFNSLPVEIKQKFDNDANKFFVQSGSKEWFDIINPLIKSEQNKESEEKIEE